MKKKGILVNNVLGLVIAVAGLAIILGFGITLYNLRINQQEKNAQATLDSLLGKVDLLKNGESNEFLIQGFSGAEDWYLVGWGKNDDVKLKPQKCFFDSCVCLCKDGPTGEVCQDNGICAKVASTNVTIITSKFTQEAFVRGEDALQEGDSYYSKSYDKKCISLRKDLMRISVNKSVDLLLIRDLDVEKALAQAGRYLECADRV